MKIILDTNILLAALIRDSITRHLIISLNVSFYYPEKSLDEIIRNKQEVLEKAEIPEEVFNTTLATLFRHINLVKENELEQYLKKADSIIGHVHKNDVVFIAAALSQDAIIWSNDQHFQKQKDIFVVTTEDIIKNWKSIITKTD